MDADPPRPAVQVEVKLTSHPCKRPTKTAVKPQDSGVTHRSDPVERDLRLVVMLVVNILVGTS